MATGILEKIISAAIYYVFRRPDSLQTGPDNRRRTLTLPSHWTPKNTREPCSGGSFGKKLRESNKTSRKLIDI
jgi:hypothetical protein